MIPRVITKGDDSWFAVTSLRLILSPFKQASGIGCSSKVHHVIAQRCHCFWCPGWCWGDLLRCVRLWWSSKPLFCMVSSITPSKDNLIWSSVFFFFFKSFLVFIGIRCRPKGICKGPVLETSQVSKICNEPLMKGAVGLCLPGSHGLDF